MVQWLRFHTPNASPIPGMGTMILCAAQHGHRKMKKKNKRPTQLYQEHTLSGLPWFCDKTDAVGLNPFIYKAYLFVDKQYWKWDKKVIHGSLLSHIDYWEISKLDLKFMQSSIPKDTTISSKNAMNLNLTSYPIVSPRLKSNSKLVFRNGVTNEIYQFISFIIYLLHVDFVADMFFI